MKSQLVKKLTQYRLQIDIEQERQPSPSEAAIDSQSVKSAAMVSEAVGYDAGKQIKGRKRFVTVDTLGLVLRVLVTAANITERDGGIQVLKKVKQMGQSVSRLHTIWVARFGGKPPPKSCLVDGGFSGEKFLHLVMDVCHWLVQVVLRPKEHKGFVLLPKRWVVERTFGWIMNCGRLTRDYEKLPETSETFIYLVMIRIMVRRLA